MLFVSLIIVPKSLLVVSRFNWKVDPFGSALDSSLERFGGSKLSGKVQCFDQAGGCIAALYNLKLAQSSGFLYDCYLFIKPESRSVAEEQEMYRKAFSHSLESSYPYLLIVTSDECGLRNPDFSYAKLKAWSFLQSFLDANYNLNEEYIPREMITWGGVPVLPYGFRMYIRKQQK